MIAQDRSAGTGRRRNCRSLEDAPLSGAESTLGSLAGRSAARGHELLVSDAPSVVKDIHCIAERAREGKTGLVADHEEAFAEAALRPVTDDAPWGAESCAAAEKQRGWGWREAPAEWERPIR